MDKVVVARAEFPDTVAHLRTPFEVDNVVLTPHIGSASIATRRAMAVLALR